jgi:hypothetical protein
MTVAIAGVVSGNISKLSISNAGVHLTIGKDVDTWFKVSTGHENYTTYASAILLAAANNFAVEVATDAKSTSIENLVVNC